MNLADGHDPHGRPPSYELSMQGSQWNQVTPQYMPWGHSPACPAAPLVTFTAGEGPSALRYPRHNLVAHCKRKADLDASLPSAKQHITEERMAAHMSRLHISSESGPEVGPEEAARSREQRLYVCEEMRRLQTESILPSALLGRLERPCMAVMLWQPPPKIPELLPTVPSHRRVPGSGRARSDDADNNNSSVLDLNNMEMDT